MIEFEEYETIDAELTSHAADGVTLDINGTQVIFKQTVAPVVVEIYVEDESEPVGAVNVARGETVSLGGVNEHLRGDVESALDGLDAAIGKLEALRERINPTGIGGDYLGSARIHVLDDETGERIDTVVIPSADDPPPDEGSSIWIEETEYVVESVRELSGHRYLCRVSDA